MSGTRETPDTENTEPQAPETDTSSRWDSEPGDWEMIDGDLVSTTEELPDDEDEAPNKSE